MEERTCACTYCDCKVPETAVPVGDKYYCCEACATAHPDRQPCQNPDCDCHKHGWGGIKT
ncbi:metallothionein [Modicisalibacter muralis]|uniref:Metallothionein n=1 Tax=Modicisalibacter muralis TaxID=119000 RepID=A0A1G9HW73_9GAMM|nr:hypothetical protein [Halomonas muralis]SDL17076.1 metallothionein [Halomonas muralis]